MEMSAQKPFSDQPWCLSILRDPAYTIIPLHDKHYEADPFFHKTLHTPCTIRKSIFMQSALNDLMSFQPDEFLMLLDVGEDIVGQTGLCHGGFLATIMDEVTGRLLSANSLDRGSSPYTVLLTVTFKSPVYAPGIILATAKMGRVEGRKMFLEATIQNNQRVIYATADALFVRKKETL
jgi:acyl-coenzyme A thioesterase PaaI-like protein